MTQPVKNEYYTSTVLDYTHQGLGVVKIDGYPVFVQDVLRDEKIEFKVIKANKKFGYGKMTKVIEPASERIIPPCEYYHQCGGCQIQPLSYDEQQAFKKGTVEANINRQAKLGVDVHDTIGMTSPDYYRNKSQIPVQKVNGELKLGLYRPRSHDIIDIKHCMIQKDIHNDIMNEVREDRKSTRLNSSHVSISYAVFCLKKKTAYSMR